MLTSLLTEDTWSNKVWSSLDLLKRAKKLQQTLFTTHTTLWEQIPFPLRFISEWKNKATKGKHLYSLMDALTCNESSWNRHTKDWHGISSTNPFKFEGGEKKNMTKWRETKASIKQAKKTTNQSDTILLAAVYTSHQVWCLQRLSERAVQNSINSWQRMQMNPDMWWSGIKETISNHDKHEVMTSLCMHTHSHNNEWRIIH